MTIERQAVVSINFKANNTAKIAEDLRNELAKPVEGAKLEGAKIADSAGGWFAGAASKLKGDLSQASEQWRKAMTAPNLQEPFGKARAEAASQPAFPVGFTKDKAISVPREVEDPFTLPSELPRPVVPAPRAPGEVEDPFALPGEGPREVDLGPQMMPQPKPAAIEVVKMAPEIQGAAVATPPPAPPAESKADTFRASSEGIVKDVVSSFGILSGSARSLAGVFERIVETKLEKPVFTGPEKDKETAFNLYRKERESIARDANKGNDAGRFLGGHGHGGLLGELNPMHGIHALLGAVAMGGTVAAASPDAMETLHTSFKLLSGQIGMAFLPAVVRVSGWLQTMADVVESIPMGVKEFIGTAAVAAAGFTALAFAANKAALALSAVGVTGGGNLMSGLANWLPMMIPFYLAATFGASHGRDNWAPGRDPVTSTIAGAGTWGTIGAVAGGTIGGIGGFIVGGPGGAVAGATYGAKWGGAIGATYGGFKGYNESGEAPEGHPTKLASNFQAEIIQNSSSYYDKILRQTNSGDELTKSMEELQEKGNTYLKEIRDTITGITPTAAQTANSAPV